MKTQVIIGSLLFLILFLTFSSVHAASGMYSNVQNITVNQSTSLISSSVSIFSSNKTMTVSASANSSNLLFSSSQFNISSTKGYAFKFFVNASSVGTYALTFKSNDSYSITIPVYVVKPPQQNISTSAYSIHVFGTVQSDSQVVIYVTDNGQTVTDGNLFIQYNNVSNHFSLSTVQSYATVDFPQLYGNVIFEYVTPTGSLVGPEIFQVANATRLPNAQVQQLEAYCNGKETNVQAGNSTVISTYTITPFENITCALYSQTTASYVEGVSLHLLSDGLPSMPYETNNFGEVTIPYPAGGWNIGVMQLSPISHDYSIGTAYFNVEPLPNPAQISAAGDNLSINPVVNQTVSITFANGTTRTIDTSNQIYISALGKIKISVSNSSYSTLNKQVILNQTSLSLSAFNNGRELSRIYTYQIYTFELTQGSSPYPYSGQVIIGGNPVQFKDGTARTYLTSVNDTSYISSQYLISPSMTVMPLTFYLNLPSNPKMNNVYNVEMVPENISNDSTIPFTGSISMVSGNKTLSIPFANGIGQVTFADTDPATFSLNNSNSLILQSQTVYPVNDEYKEITEYGAIAFFIVFLAVVFVFVRRKLTEKHESQTVFAG